MRRNCRMRGKPISVRQHFLPLHPKPRPPVQRRGKFWRAHDRDLHQLSAGRMQKGETNMKKTISISSLLPVAALALASLFTGTAQASAPGSTGPIFNLTAQPAFLNQPDGAAVYYWGYGWNGSPAGTAPAGIANATCPSMQVPGPTLIVTEGDTV